MMNSLHGNMFIRYMIEGCLDIAICIAVNLIDISESEEGLRWDTTFYMVNNISCFVLGFALMIFPVFVVIFYCRNFAKWTETSFEEKYGAIFEGLRKDRRSSLAYPIIFVFRRMVLVFIATVTKDYLIV